MPLRQQRNFVGSTKKSVIHIITIFLGFTKLNFFDLTKYFSESKVKVSITKQNVELSPPENIMQREISAK